MSKKNLFIIVIFFLFSTFQTKAQSESADKQLLEKYWYYRYRLKKQFIVLSPDNEAGTNIPANIRHQGGNNSIEWGDTEAHLGFYIAVLATEYRLLKNNGQDYTETLNELVWAMLAIDRIDYTAETYWGGKAAMNGFFVRNDGIGCDILEPDKNCNDCILNIRNNASIYKNTLLEEDSTNLPPLRYASTGYKSYNCNKKDIPEEESQDQCWHLLYGLSFVKKMTEGETHKFQNITGDTITMEQWAKKTAYRIINYMHNSKTDVNNNIKKGYIYSWYLRNAVTNEKVNVSSTGYFPGTLSYGFAEAANWITEQDYGCLHFKYSSFHITKLVFVLSLWGGTIFNYPFNFDVDNYHSRVLSTIMGDDKLLVQLGIPSTFQFLKFAASHCRTYKYQLLPLSWYVLHGKNSPFIVFKNKDKEYYEHLMLVAPNGGPFNLKNENLTGYSKEWSSVNAFVWPERLHKGKHGKGISDIDQGYYNGLDYMLLYNLYKLTFISSSTANNLYKKLNMNNFADLTDNSRYKKISEEYNLTCQMEDIIINSSSKYEDFLPLLKAIPHNK